MPRAPTRWATGGRRRTRRPSPAAAGRRRSPDSGSLALVLYLSAYEDDARGTNHVRIADLRFHAHRARRGGLRPAAGAGRPRPRAPRSGLDARREEPRDPPPRRPPRRRAGPHLQRLRPRPRPLDGPPPARQRRLEGQMLSVSVTVWVGG